MASTYSTNLAIELIGTGDQAGAWGNTTNTNLGTLIEQAISGYVTQAVSTGTDTTITIPNGATGVARNMYIELTGTGGTNTNLIVPANKKLYFIFNNTTGAVTVKVSGQTGVSVPQGKKMVLVSNGTDVVVAENYIADFGSNSATITNLTCTSLTLSNNPVLSGGTANGVLYLNGSKVATSGSVLVFDGSNLGVGVTPSTFSTGKAVQIGTTNGLTLFGFSNGAELGNNFYFNSGYKYTDNGKATRYTLGDGVHTWSIAASGTVNTAISFTQAMTLDSSGNLGIGTSSPLVPLHVVTTGTSTSAGGNAVATFRSGASGRAVTLQFSDGTVSTWVGQVSGSNISFGTSNVEAMRLDSSGNLGLGVTPSAWSGVGGVFELKGNAYIGSTTNSISLASNTYFNGSNWIYKSTAAANLYSIDTGQHKWFNAASGTAGNTISFTQAMTLDASGNLGVGTTSPYKTITVGTSDATAWITAGGSDVNLTLSSVGTNGSVVFRTGGTNSNPSTTTERARITSDGNLVIGATSTSRRLQVNTSLSTAYDSGNMETTSLSTRIVNTDGTTGNYTGIHFATSNNSDAAIAGVRTADASMALTFGTRNTGSGNIVERARITSGGILGVGVTNPTGSTADAEGIQITPTYILANRSGNAGIGVNRKTNDGDLVVFYQADDLEGSISVSGNTVSYNAFAGSHWSQLQDGSKPDILRGTVMESINELCVWPDEQNERLPKAKISDTAGSKKVYGVFMAWDNDWTETNDMYVTAVGAFICRVNGSVTVQEGDLLESNGDGTARVQADDIIRSSTIGKVTSTVKTHQYDDGSYCVPTVLYCG